MTLSANFLLAALGLDQLLYSSKVILVFFFNERLLLLLRTTLARQSRRKCMMAGLKASFNLLSSQNATQVTNIVSFSTCDRILEASDGLRTMEKQLDKMKSDGNWWQG